MVRFNTNPVPDERTLKRGGSAGAAVAFWIAFFLTFPMALRSFLDAFLVAAVFYALLCAFGAALVAAVLGHLWGMDAAKCPTVNAAFLRGGKIAALIYAAFFALAYLETPYFQKMSLLFPGVISIITFFQLVIVAGVGALHSGLTAIYVRDYLEFDRIRKIPQFTLQEIFIVFTIVSVIISAMTTIAVL
jgi:hypothetical protein